MYWSNTMTHAEGRGSLCSPFAVLLSNWVSKPDLFLLVCQRDSPLWKQCLQLLQADLSSESLKANILFLSPGFRPSLRKTLLFFCFYFLFWNCRSPHLSTPSSVQETENLAMLLFLDRVVDMPTRI